MKRASRQAKTDYYLSKLNSHIDLVSNAMDINGNIAIIVIAKHIHLGIHFERSLPVTNDTGN